MCQQCHGRTILGTNESDNDRRTPINADRLIIEKYILGATSGLLMIVYMRQSRFIYVYRTRTSLSIIY